MLFLLPILSSCVSHKNLLIIQNPQTRIADSIAHANVIRNYKVQPEDVLHIEISSTASSQLEIFTNKFEEPSRIQANDIAVFLNGYVVSQDGKIRLPLIGEVEVKNLTVEEISKKIKDMLQEYINFVTVSTKLTSFRVTVLGEVKSPGTFMIYNTHANILQAIGLAGDLTEYSNKRNVKLIRKSPQGPVEINLDISKISITESKYFYLEPNDVIYVEPLKAKVLRVNAPAIQLTVSIITLGIVILNFLKN